MGRIADVDEADCAADGVGGDQRLAVGRGSENLGNRGGGDGGVLVVGERADALELEVVLAVARTPAGAATPTTPAQRVTSASLFIVAVLRWGAKGQVTVTARVATPLRRCDIGASGRRGIVGRMVRSPSSTSPRSSKAAPPPRPSAALDLARHAEALGYTRYWLAEHHNMPGIASAATAVLIAHVGGGTSTHPRRRRRHHAAQPRAAAGGRAVRHARVAVPGAGRPRPRPCARHRSGRRRGAAPHAARRPRRVPRGRAGIAGLLGDPQPGQRVRAVPGAGLRVPVWILGSSLFGAQVAAALGLPFAFASHFAPALLAEAIAHLPRALHAVGVLGRAVPDAGRQRRRRRHRRRGAVPGLVGPPVVCEPARRPARFRCRRRRPNGPATRPRARRSAARTRVSFVGSPGEVAAGMREFVARTGADELIVVSHIYDHAARLRSYEIAAMALARRRAQLSCPPQRPRPHQVGLRREIDGGVEVLDGRLERGAGLARSGPRRPARRRG